MSVEAKGTKPVGTNRKEYSPVGRVIRSFGIQIGIVAVAAIVVYLLLRRRKKGGEQRVEVPR